TLSTSTTYTLSLHDALPISLMDQNEDRALPILKKILTGNSSSKVKDKAMFVLSQNESPASQQLLGDIAIGKEYPQLQEKAIHYLDRKSTRLNSSHQIISYAV